MSNEVGDNLRKLSKNLDDKFKPAMANACGIVRNDAIKGAPQKTGALKRSIDFEVSNDGMEGVIYSNLEYAPYVEKGTGVYGEGGRDTPWVFPYYDNGSTSFARTTGQKARPFLEPALQQNNSKIKDCFKELF